MIILAKLPLCISIPFINAYWQQRNHTSWFGLKHNGSDLIVFDTQGNVTNKFAKDELSKHKQKAWYHDVVDDKASI